MPAIQLNKLRSFCFFSRSWELAERVRQNALS